LLRADILKLVHVHVHVHVHGTNQLQKFDGRRHDLVNRYGVYVSQMTTDMCHLS
jgi:hypothetical protein